MVRLPILAGAAGAATTGVSADGTTVVGYAWSSCCDLVAWRWTTATGMQSISDWLADVGVNATGAGFYSAYAVTADGKGVVGQLNSGTAYLALVKVNHAATPTYSPIAGTYADAQQVTINDTAPTAAIYYTTDGSTPTANSTPYTGPIQVSLNTTIKSIAMVSGYPRSPVATGVYKIRVATPTYSPKPGAYKGQQQVTIDDATPNATIHYTTDGSAPTASSMVYTIPIAVSGPITTIKSIAIASGYAQSTVAAGVYRIK